jgi:hypothetical protein
MLKAHLSSRCALGRPATVSGDLGILEGRIIVHQLKAADAFNLCRAFPMPKRLMAAVACLVAASVAQTVLCAPLEATALYKGIAHGCRTLGLKSWSHPTRQVLERAKIKIKKVELCNQGIYPIYTVRFDASPMLGVNDKYFNKIYTEMAAANGFHSFAFVDPGWGVIVTVDVSGKKEISISYDEFDAAEAK